MCAANAAFFSSARWQEPGTGCVVGTYSARIVLDQPIEHVVCVSAGTTRALEHRRFQPAAVDDLLLRERGHIVSSEKPRALDVRCARKSVAVAAVLRLDWRDRAFLHPVKGVGLAQMAALREALARRTRTVPKARRRRGVGAQPQKAVGNLILCEISKFGDAKGQVAHDGRHAVRQAALLLS